MPLLNRTRWPIAISLCLGCGALFVDLGVNHQNILSFLPYYVAGNRLPRSLWSRDASQPWLRVPFALFFLAVNTRSFDLHFPLNQQATRLLRNQSLKIYGGTIAVRQDTSKPHVIIFFMH